MFYSTTPTALRVNLLGTLLSASGQRFLGEPAASLGNITFLTGSGALFQPSQFLRINACAITSVNCVLVTREGVPIRNPTINLPKMPVFDVLTDPDVVLPTLSDLDY